MRPSSLTPSGYPRGGPGADEEFFTWDSHKQQQMQMQPSSSAMGPADMQSSYWPGTIGMSSGGGGVPPMRGMPSGWGSSGNFQQQPSDVDSWRGGSAAAAYPPPASMHHQQYASHLVQRHPQPRHRVEEEVSLDTLPRFLPATDRPPSASTVASTVTSDVSYEPRPLETYM